MPEREQDGMPVWLLLVAMVGGGAALGGGMWDDAWHTERGRDTFFIAPHIAIYAGIATVGAALAWRVLSVARRSGVAAVRRDAPLALAAIAVAATLLSGPIDDAWHRAFGRDSVIWSPPHMLGIVGTLALGAALLADAGRRRLVGPAAGALVLAAAVFPVVEYDTDVPQFDALWYLPVLAAGFGVAQRLIALTAGGRASPRTSAAAIHLAVLGALSLFLLAVGFEPPALPLLVVPAVALDAADRRGLQPLSRAAIGAVALYAAYVPARNWLGDGVQIDADDVALGLPIAFAVLLVIEVIGERSVRGRLVAATMMLVLLAAAPAALAHDPGQGDPAGTAALVATADGHRLSLSGRLAPCAPIARGDLVARRAGLVVRAPLRVRGCSFRGVVRVSQRGRWFLYADLRAGDRMLESWLPIDAGDGRRTIRERDRHAYSPPRREAGPIKAAASVGLYGAMVALLAGCVLVAGRASDDRPVAHP